MIKAITNWLQILVALGTAAILVYLMVEYPKDTFPHIFAKIIGVIIGLEYLGVFFVRLFTNCVTNYQRENFAAKCAYEMKLYEIREAQNASRDK